MGTKALALVGSLLLGAGWALSSATAPAPVRQQADTAPRAPFAAAATPPAPAATLRLKLRRRSAVPTPTRNPFRFGSGSSLRNAGGAPTPVVPVDVPPSVAASPIEPYTLSGMAMSGDKRTAIISAGGSMHLVTVFDMLPNGDTVVRIDDTSVTLADVWGNERQLRLR